MVSIVVSSRSTPSRATPWTGIRGIRRETTDDETARDVGDARDDDARDDDADDR